MHISLDSALGRQRRLNSVGESVLQIAPNAAAAYSLRSLTGGDPKVVRVRRASDNGERDFTSSEITSGEMVSWVNQQVIKPLDIQALEADGRTGDFLIAKAAYALRSLGTRQATLAATGDTVARANGKFVVQVRRSSDDALKSFTADEITDGTLLAFVGTGGSDNGFVKTWYDQSVTNEAGDTATGNHAVQATAASQPKIVNAGSLLNELDFDGTDDTLAIDFGADLSQANSLFMVHQSDTTTGSANEFFDSSSSDSPRTLLDKSGSDYRMLAESSVGTGVAVTTDKSLIFALYNGASSLFAKNGTATSALNAGTADINQNSTLGSSDTRFYDGTMQEFIVYNSDQTDNRTAIEANIGEAYSITGIPAYDDEVDGFVETWYDQSGNSNDVTQATAGSQPKIVNAGSLVTVGSRASFKFDGSSDFLERETYTQGSLSQPNTFFSVAELDAYADENRKVYDSHVSTARNMLQLNTAGNGQFAHFAGTVAATGEDADADRHLFTSLMNGASSDLRIDGTSKTTANTASQAMTGIVIGANHNTAENFWDGDIQEIIIYNSNQSSTTTAVETNINSHYSIF